MTDLISSLADSIISLINAKPASPSKEEVEQVLRGSHLNVIATMLRSALDAGELASFPPGLTRKTADFERELLRTAIDAQMLASYPMFVMRKGDHDMRVAEMLHVPFKDMEPTIAVGQADQPCIGSTDGTHCWDYRPERHCMACGCGATAPPGFSPKP